MIPADHAVHHLVRLTAARHLRVFDLRTEANLDILGVDDQISTGQHPDVWDTCHRLADAAHRWWNDLDALVYRARTTPETSVNYAFFALDAFACESWPLARSGRHPHRTRVAPRLHRQLGHRRRDLALRP